MSIGERIIELRKMQGLTQNQLAKSMEVSRQAVSKWESDQTVPDCKNMIRLAEVLATDIEYLSVGRRTLGIRPPVVINTVETVEKVIEKPVIQEVEKIIERIVEKPVVKYIEKPVVKKVYRTEYVRNPLEYALCIGVGLIVGLLVGLIF